jgi:zinc protease
MKKSFLYLATILPLGLIAAACNINTQQSPSASIPQKQPILNVVENRFTGNVPLSPKIIKGELANGMQYIIRQNDKPEKRAEIRLVINAGSVLEDENQLGFAHFAEHMAFNGTEDFKKQEIVEYVESIGMKFGAHLNAHTSFDETVYKLQVPTDDKVTLEKGIHILENWAHKISFEPEEIDKERGVVIEEMRTRLGANTRIMYKQLPVIFKDSQYAKRLPIGDKDILAKGKHEDLIRFYKDWYRPDLMSLIAVGDFDPEEVKTLFEKYFSNISAATTVQKPREQYVIPDNVSPLISIETDPELIRNLVSIHVKRPLFEPQTYADYREALKHQLFIGMLNSRYLENVLKPDSPIIGSRASFGRSFGDKSIFSIGSAVKPGKTNEALVFLLTEVNRAIQHGFNEAELARQKASIKNSNEKRAKEANNIESRNLASQYVRYFMKNENSPGVIHQNEIVQHFLENISLEEVNKIAKSWMTEENRLISISGPDTEKVNLPSQNDVLAIWDQVDSSKLTPYLEVAIGDKLLNTPPKKGSIVDKNYNESLGTHTWVLSNGAKVFLKKTNFKEDTILFSARSAGGFSLITEDLYKQTFMASYIAKMMGVGEFSINDFNKFMKGKSFNLSSEIHDKYQKLKGSSSVKDIEHFLQMLNLQFYSPRKDKDAFDTVIAGAAPYYENMLISPQSVFNEAIRKIQYANDPRSFQIDGAAIEGIELDKSLQLYHDRFSNAANFNFVFVGNFDLEKMENLVTTYIASLPANENKETWKQRPDLREKGKLSLTVKKGLEQKANVVMRLFGETQWSHLEDRKFKTLLGVLRTVLRERIREDKGGVYGVRVNGHLSKDDNHYSLNISFSCDPQRNDELIAEIQTIFNELKVEVTPDKYVKNYIAQELKTNEVNKKNNWFWLNYLTWYAEPDYQVLSFLEFDELLQAMTPLQVKESANKFLNMDDSLIAVLLPQEENANK